MAVAPRSWQDVGVRTITRSDAPPAAHGQRRPFLFLVLQCDRPLSVGARFPLVGADEVAIGRAPALDFEDSAGPPRIGIPDARMSSSHVRLQRGAGSWIAEDQGSKNGTFVDGKRIKRQDLRNGMVLELGHTFLLFRELVADADFLNATELGPPAAGMATLLPSFAAELDRVKLVAASRVPILLRGESGTGKEVLAAAIHRASGRPGALQAVNCGAIPANLVESELFGHRRGAFSGAVDDHPGLIRGADRGTLLLDEIGYLPLAAQASLLRVLQDEQVLAVGATNPVKVDLRVIAATHRDLDALVAAQQFRPDLLARLSGYTCALPPLRERREDFSLLVASLLSRIGVPEATFSPEAARALLRHSWPLNVRELEKCLSSAAVLARGGRIEKEHLPATVVTSPAPNLPEPVVDKRREEMISLLLEHGGNVTAVARSMGKARTQVQRWLRKFNIDPVSFRR
jgi:transcriptional regulator of acetoin/glycerol metabolism